MDYNRKTIVYHINSDITIEYPIITSNNEYQAIFNAAINNEYDIFLDNSTNSYYWKITDRILHTMGGIKKHIY